MAGVQRGRHVDQRLQATHAFLSVLQIRIAAVQVSTKAQRKIHFAAVSGMHAGHGVIAGARGDFDPQPFLQLLKQRRLQRRSHTDGAQALHVAVPANRHHAGFATPDHSS